MIKGLLILKYREEIVRLNLEMKAFEELKETNPYFYGNIIENHKIRIEHLKSRIDDIERFNLINFCSMKANLNNFKKFLVMTLLILLFIGIFYLKPVIIGYVVEQNSIKYSIEINKTFSNPGIYVFDIGKKGILTSLKISGNAVGQGKIKVYLVKDSINYTILDSSNLKEKGVPITGLAAKEDKDKGRDNKDNGTFPEESTNDTMREIAPLNETHMTNGTINITPIINETIDITQPIINESIETAERPTKEIPIINEKLNITPPTINKSITINLEYNKNSPYDENNDGVETITGIIDFTAENTKFNWQADSSKLCARWEVYNAEEGLLTKFCNGNSDCCGFFELLPTKQNWDEIYYSTYGKDGAGHDNIVSAQVVYYDVNLSPENLKSEIYNSEWGNLSVKFFEEEIEFFDECIDTCLLFGLNKSSYTLIFEIEDDAILRIDKITYSLLTDVENNAPKLLKNITSINVSKNKDATINLSKYFIDSDGDKLGYGYYPADNITIAFDGDIATIIPDKGVEGIRYSYFIANDSELTAVSDVFVINVSQEKFKPKVEIGKPVKWQQVILVDTNATSVNLSIPETASNVTITILNDTIQKELPDEKIKVIEDGRLKDKELFEVEKSLDKIRRKIAILEEAKLEEFSKVAVEEGEFDEFNIDPKLNELYSKEAELEQQLDGLSDESLITGNAFAALTGNVIALTETALNDTQPILVINESLQQNIEVTIEYETEAPIAIENEINAYTKQVKVVSETSYEDVLSHTTLNDVPQNAIKLYWIQDNERVLFNNINYIDENNNNLIDRIEWVIPHLSNQTFEVVIEIIKAVHLDENKIFLNDIFNEVKSLDNIWSEPIYENQYVRVTFEQKLDAAKDITVYARNNQSLNTKIEVYYFNSTDKITEFPIITAVQYYKVLLTSLNGTHDTFDLKVVNNDSAAAYLEFDHIIDPTFVDDNDTNWNNGTLNNMVVQGTGAAANLTSSGRNVSGSFGSRVFDAGSVANWTNITIEAEVPYGAELGRAVRDFNNTNVQGGINTSGLVVLYHFNNETGETDSLIKDYSNGINVTNATPSANVKFTKNGFFNGGYNFTGTDEDNIAVSSYSHLNNLAQFTYSIWVKPFSNKNTGLEADMVLVSKETKGFTLKNDLTIFAEVVTSSTYRRAFSNDVYALNSWNNIVASYSSTDNLVRLYLNGNEVSYSSQTTGSGTDSDDSAFPIRFGAAANNIYYGNLNGTIDEVSIWNRTLRADEIKNLYKRGALGLNLSARSCDDSACSGETYTRIANITQMSTISLNLSATNRYFQYNLTFSSNATNTSIDRVVINNVSIGYFTIPDTTLPTVNASLNQSLNNISQNYIINVTANVTDETGLSFCRFVDNQSLANGAKQFINKTVAGTTDQCSQNYTIALSTGNVINFTVIVNDTGNNLRMNDTIITVVVAGDPTPPSITLDQPINNTNTSLRNITFRFTATDASGLKNATLFANFSGQFIANQSNQTGLTSGTQAAIFANNTINEGFFIWNIFACDNAGTPNCGFANANFTLRVDRVPPAFSNIVKNISDYQFYPIQYNATWNDSNSLFGYIFSFNRSGTWVNTTLIRFGDVSSAVSINITVINDTPGTVLGWQFYANDSAGNLNYTPVQTFMVGGIIWNLTIFNMGTAAQNSANITSSTAIIGYLNNSNVSIGCISGNCSIITTNYTVRDVNDTTNLVYFNCSTIKDGSLEANYSINSTQDYNNSYLIVRCTIQTIVKLLSPANATKVDRDRVDGVDADNVTLLVQLSNSSAGINVTFKMNLTKPIIAGESNIRVGNSTTDALGNANISWNGSDIDSDKMFAGNYTWWVEVNGAQNDTSRYVYLFGGLNITFRFTNLNPNSTYEQGQIVKIEELLKSRGPESPTQINSTYLAKVNTTLTDPAGVNFTVELFDPEIKEGETASNAAVAETDRKRKSIFNAVTSWIYKMLNS